MILIILYNKDRFKSPKWYPPGFFKKSLRAYGTLSLEKPPTNKGTIKTHTTINNKFMESTNISPKIERDLTTPTLNLLHNFTIITPGNQPEAYRNHLQQNIDNTPSDTITCYTDGSKTDEGCGADLIITTNNNSSYNMLPCPQFHTLVTLVTLGASYTNLTHILHASLRSDLHAKYTLFTRILHLLRVL